VTSYSASVVKIFSVTSSLLGYEIKKIFFYFEKRYISAGVVVVNSKVVGLALGANPTIASYNPTGNLVIF
jgi:hypothetical protein